MKTQTTFNLSILLILASIYCVNGDASIPDNLTDFFACDSNIVYAVGDRGTIIKTIDGGLSWKIIKSSDLTALYSVYFVSEETGWVAGIGGNILHTMDGGKNWINQNSNTDAFLKSIYFINKFTGWIIGWATILHTDDGGKVWVSNDQSILLNYVYFFDENLGFIVGDQGTILRTTDRGSSWIKQDSGFDGNLESIGFSSATKGFAVGSIRSIIGPHAAMLKTLDGGKTWSDVNSVGDRFRSISFGDTHTGYAYAEIYTLLKTEDGGNNWHNIYLYSPIKLPTTINTVKFIDKNIGWAVGGGTEKILKTTDGGNNWEYQTNITTRTSYLPDVESHNSQLIGNFPNPFNFATTINFSLGWSGQVKISIYNIKGELVINLVNKYMTRGYHSIKWDAEETSSGIYFYQLIHNGKVTDIKRLLLLK